MQVWHMNGAGNDFMVMDARDQELDFSQLAKKLCKLTGADGFMAVDESAIADLRLHFYNSDGSRGEMCGNGSRCVCAFAYENGIASEQMAVQTDAGIIYGSRLGENRYQVELNLPSVMDLHRTEDSAYVELGDPGVPHAVTELPELRWEQQESYRKKGVSLRYDPAFPKGANVNFFTRLDEENVRVLTYERHVEDFTLACGTGCASIACVLWTKGQLPEGKLVAHNRGGTLIVTVESDGTKIRRLLQEGPVEVTKIYEL